MIYSKARILTIMCGLAVLAGCTSRPSEPIHLPAPIPAPAVSTAAPSAAPSAAPNDAAIEQAADDYVDAFVASEPDLIYGMTSKTFTDVVDRQTFAADWKRCNAEVPEHYDVVSWTAMADRAVVVVNADGARRLLELRLENGRWMWLPPTGDICP